MKIITKKERSSFPELELFRVSFSCNGEVVFPGDLNVVDRGSV